MSPLVDRLRSSLRDAMLARDRDTAAVLRTVLAAIDNAGAVDAPTGGLAVEEAPIGAGSSDVARREVAGKEIEAIVRSEIGDLEAAAARYRELGRAEEAETLLTGAATLRSLLG